jgi:ATP-dependent DNA helicase RecG
MRFAHFANDLPATEKVGVLLVGVSDAGEPVGLPISDKLLLELSSIRSDGNILPFPNLTVYKAALNGVEIAVVEVVPSHEPPLRLRGTVRVRPGPRRGVATRDEERVLTERRRGWDHRFDQRAVSGATFEDLDLRMFEQEYLPAAVSAEVLREMVAVQQSSLRLCTWRVLMLYRRSLECCCWGSSQRLGLRALMFSFCGLMERS